jgi:hypothetical protein
MANFRQQLEDLNPNVSLSVELPNNGNGNLFQARTTVAEGVIFYGRADTEEEAILKCCQKAVKHLVKNNDLNSNYAPNAPTASNGANGGGSGGRAPVASRTTAHVSSKFRPGHKKTRISQPSSSDYNLNNPETGPVTKSPDSRVSWILDSWATLRLNEDAPADHKRSKQSLQNKSTAAVEQPNNRIRDRGNNRRDREDNRRADRGGDNRRGTNTRRDMSPTPSYATSTMTSPCRLSIDEDVLAALKGKPVQIKNAVMMLNEMFPPPRAPQYKVTSQTGPPNNPTFAMVCCIQDTNFSGEGKSKKESICGYKMSDTKSVPEKSNPRANCDLDDWMELEGKNPVSILNELYPGIQYRE